MSGNTRQIFHGITRAIFARLRKKASKIGIRVAARTEKSKRMESSSSGTTMPRRNCSRWNAERRFGSTPHASAGISVKKLRPLGDPAELLEPHNRVWSRESPHADSFP